jgi:adenosylcobinamide-GDP ribazoletransferase
VRRRRAPAPPVRTGPTTSLLTAISLFTVVPVPSPTRHRLDRSQAARAVLWLPVLGALLGGTAAAVLLAVDQLAVGAPGRLLAAVLAILTLAALTGGMHLDGLADTVDGLASHRPAREAIEVMRRSDVGPLGAASLLFVLLLQIVALAAVPVAADGAAALVLAAVTSRTAVLMAAGRQVPSARPEGFGALVSGTVGPQAQAAILASLVLLVGLVAALFAGPSASVRSLGALSVGLLISDLVRRLVQRRLGGMTGDVFGALIEITTASVLLTAALVRGIA